MLNPGTGLQLYTCKVDAVLSFCSYQLVQSMRVTPASSFLNHRCFALALAIVLNGVFLAPNMVLASEPAAALDTHNMAVPAVAHTGIEVQAKPSSTVAGLPVIHVGNFERVSSTLMRGGAPSAKALKELKDAGVKTILNLRGDGAASRKEERSAKEIGLDYYNIPMGYTEPSLTKVSSILDIIRDPQKQPVYVHCLQGADRTGMIVGIHRVLSDGWQFDQVYSEMRGHHFKPFLIPMRKTVQAFASGKYTYVERQGVSIAGVASKAQTAKVAVDKSL